MKVTVLGVDVTIDETYIDAEPAEIARQIEEYVRGERRSFDLDVTFPQDFTGRVMRRIAEIPYGDTQTYGALAADLDTAAIAVGGGCGRNHVPIVVPCHRVVGATGLGGYSGGGERALDLKRDLIELERGNRQPRTRLD